jgi:crotonobetainyl-CoA hydratase
VSALVVYATPRGVRAWSEDQEGDDAMTDPAVVHAPAAGSDAVLAEPCGFPGFVHHAISKPVLAAVNGFALGGGTEMVLASDLAVAVGRASFGLPDVKPGIFAGAGRRVPARPADTGHHRELGTSRQLRGQTDEH